MPHIKTDRNRQKALAAALIAHLLLLLFCLFWIIRTPIPPFPEGSSPGLEVNLGNMEDGMGEIQPDLFGEEAKNAITKEAIVQPNPQNAAPSFAEPTENLLSQETEEAPEVIKQNEPLSGNTPTETVPKKETENPVASLDNPSKPSEPEPRKTNSKALYPGGKGGKGGNEGETGKPGDQGDPDGSKNSKYHGSGGSRGNSSGDGDGDGDGKGKGKGKDGVSYSLAGRKPQALVVPESREQEEGKVVVEITVDKKGVVIRAKGGARGSTTTNANLVRIAENAALMVRFNPDSDAEEIQKGTITYTFINR